MFAYKMFMCEPPLLELLVVIRCMCNSSWQKNVVTAIVGCAYLGKCCCALDMFLFVTHRFPSMPLPKERRGKLVLCLVVCF